MTGEFKYLGTTDECVTCERCGRTELRNTVVLGALDADGNVEGVAYFGSSCAARALGVDSPANVLKAARAAHYRAEVAAKDARRMLEGYGLPVDGVITADMVTRAACGYAADNPRACTSFDAAIEATMDFIARKRRDIREYELLKGA